MNHNLNHKRKFSNLRRTDNNEDYLGTTPSTSHMDHCIQHDIDQEIENLERQISVLYQQIKIRKEKIESIKIERAVKKAKKETEERVRRESNKWLPTLDKVTEIQQSIIKNLSDNDENSTESSDINEDDTVADFLHFVKKTNC
jgi:chaperonin cofactor prefoldin